MLDRGVWQANFLGPAGEIYLVAISHAHRLIARRVVADGENRIQAAEELQDELDRVDPASTERRHLRLVRDDPATSEPSESLPAPASA